MTLHVCKHSNLLCSVIFVNFYNFFSTMTSLCRHLSVVSTGNCKLGHDCRRPTGVFTPPTQRNSTVSSRRRRRCVSYRLISLITVVQSAVIKHFDKTFSRCCRDVLGSVACYATFKALIFLVLS